MYCLWLYGFGDVVYESAGESYLLGEFYLANYIFATVNQFRRDVYPGAGDRKGVSLATLNAPTTRKDSTFFSNKKILRKKSYEKI